MKRDILESLVKTRLKELKDEGFERYQLYDFCEEVVPSDERQSKHVDILEMLLDWGYRIEWKGLKFQPKVRDIK